jgi:hypothetical protein
LVASSYNEYAAGTIREAAVINSLDVGGSKAKHGRVFAYVVPKIEGEHGIILGHPWKRSKDMVIDPKTETLHIQRTGVIVRNRALYEYCPGLSSHILSPSQTLWSRQMPHSQNQPQVFAVSLADIEKALWTKPRTNPCTKLPQEYMKWRLAFDRQEANKLPPHQPGTDHAIEMEEKDGRPLQIPSSLLYGMSQEMLLVLCKTLTELLDKGFI